MTSSNDEPCSYISVEIPELNNGECSNLSSHSSFSDPEFVQIPTDICDGPKFDDLAGHLESVVSSAWHKYSEENAVVRQTVDITDPSLSAASVEGSENSRLECQDAPLSGLNFDFPANASHSNFEAFAQFDNSFNELSESANWATGSTNTSVYKPSDRIEQPGAQSGDVWSPGEPQVSEDDSNDDFGEFQSSVVPPEPPTKNDSDLNTPNDFSQSVSENHCLLERLLTRLEPALQHAFSHSLESSEHTGSSGGPITLCFSDDTDRHSCVPSPTSIPSTHLGVWHQLFTPTRLLELQQQWGYSKLRIAYHRAINVDTGKMKPAFASQLGLLEPVKLAAVLRQPSPCEHSTTPTGDLEAPSGPEILVATKFPQSNPVGEEKSGVTLNHGPASQLDLDYFEKQLPSSLSQTDTCPSGANTDFLVPRSQTGPVTLLPTAPPATGSSRGVSQTVKSVLSRLPNIRYMRSNTLVFPSQDDAPRAGGAKP